MKSRPALVACDLDGTLLDDSGAVAPGVVEALGELRAAGVLVVICTGRTVAATRAAATRLGLESGPAIAYHGAVVVDLADGHWLRRLDLPADCVAPIVGALRGAGAEVTAYVDDERRTEAELGGASVTRLIVDGGEQAGGDLAGRLATLTAGWSSVAVSAAPGGRFEVHHAAADKGAALAALCGRLDLKASAVVACGDGAVDAPMLRWAGLGVAIAGGHADALAAADLVIDRDELARVLASLVSPAG